MHHVTNLILLCIILYFTTEYFYIEYDDSHNLYHELVKITRKFTLWQWCIRDALHKWAFYLLTNLYATDCMACRVNWLLTWTVKKKLKVKARISS